MELDGWTKETRETQAMKERSRTMTANSIIGSRQPLIQTSLLSLSSQKKVFTRYIDTENNNIYISDIIISIIYTTLITLVSEIRRVRKSVRSFFFIGKTNERTNKRENKSCPSIQLHRENGWMDRTPSLPPEPKRRCVLSLVCHNVTLSQGVGCVTRCDKCDKSISNE